MHCYEMQCGESAKFSNFTVGCTVRTYETEILRNSHPIKEESFTTELATNFTSETVSCAICFRQNYVVVEPVL